MRPRLRTAAAVLFLLGAVLVFWPWHRTYEGIHLTCGPAIVAAFPSDPGTQRGVERRADDQCMYFAVKSAGLGAILFAIGGYSVVRANRGRYAPPKPMKPPEGNEILDTEG